MDKSAHTSNPTNLVTSTHLWKSFPTGDHFTTVLKDINLNIKKGEFVILFGPSGCGKSTFLNTLMGLEHPDKGNVNFMGMNLWELNSDDRAVIRKSNVGIIYQQQNWVKSLSVVENVAVVGSLLGMKKEEAEALAREKLEIVGMTHRADYKPYELSSGEQQRISLARSLMSQPSTESSEYSLMINELEDGTDYHYKIVLTDEEGFEYESFEDHVFSTPPRPQVSNVQIQEKKGVPTPTIEVFWESNIPVNSIVRYSSNGKTLDKVDMELIEGEHVMEISGLDPDSAYQLTVEGVDSMGNRATSDVYAFTTATDTRPPEVFGIKSEGDIQSTDIQSDRARSAQLIISWETDEPSTSQVLYGEGAANDGYPYSTQTDAEMRYKHVIIVSNLSPSRVYHFKVVSKDSAGNVGESGSVTSITPKSTNTVIESVLGSLGRIFDFL
jgi:ABC-type lipoprotein export system ATPase subunit